ncbi:MAG: hypothetical protein WCK21_06760, partial [Actinomycetota bacterium]
PRCNSVVAPRHRDRRGRQLRFTLVPCGDESADYLKRLMARVEGIPLEALEAALRWDWSSFSDWFERFNGAVAVNAGFLAGHSAIRRDVMGPDAVGEIATPEQRERWRAAARRWRYRFFHVADAQPPRQRRAAGVVEVRGPRGGASDSPRG